MQKIYLVWANSDSTEGRGHDVVKYICSNEVAAKEVARHLGPMGASDGHITQDWLIDSKYELQQKIRDEFIRKEALSKLSDDEKRVLGVK